MNNFYDYIRERSSWSGCKQNKWDCGKYLDCDKCLEDKIMEHEKQIRSDTIDEFVNILINPSNYDRYAFYDCLSDSNKAYDFMFYVYDIAKQLKEHNNERT